MEHRGIVLVVALLLGIQLSVSASTVGNRLSAALQSGGGAGTYRVWVTFSDKGTDVLQKAQDPLSVVSERSLARRQNVMKAEALIDESDLPVETAYVQAVEATGASLRHRSRWFNALSVTATPDQIRAIALLPFVKEVELTGTYGRRQADPPVADPAEPARILPKTGGIHALDYGPSEAQVQQINVPAIHDLGNHAEGVMVGVFDNGFRILNHEAMASMNIVAMYDFVDRKTSVIPNNPAGNFGGHGVNTLSVIGGYAPGKLVGPAFGASFILARTENDSSETPVEEDNWVAAIEWADSIGVQVTSTSLGYLDYNYPFTSWTWEDMDGRTTLISRAAAMAVRKGILVVNSAGNEGYSATHNTLGAPADADSVLAVGAVSSSGTRTSFSSVGPTTANPPRIKPDVMALGTGVYNASSSDTVGYSAFGQGTSYACPLAAGVAALLVKAVPTASPMAVINAMKLTASNSANPNREMGWGVLNAKAALDHLAGGDTSISPDVPSAFALTQNYPNPFNPSTNIGYSVGVVGRQSLVVSNVRLAVYDLLGREVAVLVDAAKTPGRYTVTWDARGRASGVYFYRLTAGGVSETKTMLLLR